MVELRALAHRSLLALLTLAAIVMMLLAGLLFVSARAATDDSSSRGVWLGSGTGKPRPPPR
jgi:hypothetical protein